MESARAQLSVLGRPLDNLPLELTSFIGRERQVAELRDLLGEQRLLTLCGPGGSGKTRLALAVAQEVVEDYEDGVWWVDLASISDPKLVPFAVATALGVREMPDRSLAASLAEYLEPRSSLLVLDNCEHLVYGSAALADALLRRCPYLKILATSREPLRVAGEAMWMVPSLSLPDPRGRTSAEQLAGYEALRLFVDRARQASASFALTDRNASVVARLCGRLDGIPLAIELAAARVRALTVEQISERLEDPLSLLTTGSRTAAPRHQTLRAALQWSYELLDEQERGLFERLSVFAGGWDLEAAEAIGAEDPARAMEILDLLSMLMDKSLVSVDRNEEQGTSLRYRMLEPVRQFGREKLRENVAARDAPRRHAEYFLGFAQRADRELLGSNQALWLQRLRTELGNLRRALEWSLDHEERAGLRLRLVAALGRFWGREGFEEGKWWLQAALESDPGGLPVVRAKALGELGFILLFQQNYAPAISALEECVAIYKDLGDETGAAYALANLGQAAIHGAYRERLPSFEREGAELLEGGLAGHPRAYLLVMLGMAAQGEGNLDRAASRLEEGLSLCLGLGSLREASMAYFILGNVEIDRHRFDVGAALLLEGTRITRELGDHLGTAYYVWGLGRVAVLRKNHERAARLWGAAEKLREHMGMSLSPFDVTQSGYEQDLHSVRSSLGAARFEAAWAEGRAMSAVQATEYALEDAVPEQSAAAPHPTRAPEPEEFHQARLCVFALGPARVEKEGLPLDSPDWIQKSRELLYYLLSHPQGRTKEQIGLALWPEASTAQLRSSFHDTVFRLRRALGGKEWVVFERRRYAFGRSLDYSYDVENFENNVSEARRLQDEAPDTSIRYLQKAAELYRGDFLEDIAQGEWALGRQEDLRRAYVESLLLLGGLLVSQKRPAEATEAYRKAISHDRFTEEAHRGLMRSLAANGEPGGALRHYEELARMLEEQLGASPAPETVALYESLRSRE
jgi:predicted ATPase/DNA-binding SARP family transcriptional activator